MLNTPRIRLFAPPAQTRFPSYGFDRPPRRSGGLLQGKMPSARAFRLAILCLFPFLLTILMGLFPTWPSPRQETSRNSLTRPASRTPLTPAEEKTFPSAQPLRRTTPFASPRAGGRSVSRPISLIPLPVEADLPFFSHQESAPGNAGALLTFSWGRVFLETSEGNLPLERFAELFPKAPASAPETALSPLPGQRPDEALLLASAVFCDQEPDSPGDPLALWTGESLLGPKGAGPCSLNDNTDLVAVRRLIAGLNIAAAPGKAGKYRAMAEAYARKYTLAPSLVLAIMHTESNFNPLAVSASSALGLMQIVPETAGNEVYRYLKGAHGVPTTETLFSPESNIQYGTAYLHLLARRYFQEVIDPTSREMCVIAAYNGGPGAVLRLFDPDRDVAVARINTLTPDQLYTALTTRMPNRETRRYVEVVLEHQRSYAR